MAGFVRADPGDLRDRGRRPRGRGQPTWLRARRERGCRTIGGAEPIKPEELKTARELDAESLKDPEYRAEWERTRLAHPVAMRVIAYRVEHNLTQTELARRLGMRQPHMARLEAGDHEPSVVTLQRLSHVLGPLHIDVTPEAATLTA